jgi:hypothetical protein
MSETKGGLKDVLADSPAVDRLKEEAQRYLAARAEKAVSGLGERLGGSLERLGDPSGGGGGLLGSLTQGGKELAEGKSPAKAALKVGTSQLKDKVKGAFGGGGGGGRNKSGGGGGKSMTIIEDIDVGVPVRVAYDQWTQFQEFGTFAKGVVNVDTQDDEVSSNWTAKVAKSTRTWKATVTEQVPDQRISWTSEGAKATVKGVITFHPLGENLTKVLLVLEYFPSGFFEKTGNLWRAQGRRARLDLKLYRKFLTLRGEATDGWRGEIRDGEVVKDHETAVREEEESENQDGEGEPEEGEEPEEDALEDEGEPEEYDEEDEEEAEESEEPQDEYDDEETEEEEEEEDEEEPEPEAPRSRRRSATRR